MTDYDMQLIAEANTYHHRCYSRVEDLMAKANTHEARERLWVIRCELYDLMMETL